MSRLLIVEDDEQLLFILSKSLENVGYKTLMAKNGDEGIELLNQYQDIDLVVTDLMMPVVDGIQLCNFIRSKPEYEYLPILIITGQSDIYYKCQGFNAGADDYITKPVEFVEFMLRVKALLKRNHRFTPKFQNDLANDENLVRTDNQKNSDKGILLKLDKNTSKITVNSKEVYLTSTEFEIINYLLQKKQEPTNTEEFLEKLMNYPHGAGNPVAIRTHIRNIRSKIEKDPNNPEIIINIPKRGYILNTKNIST